MPSMQFKYFPFYNAIPLYAHHIKNYEVIHHNWTSAAQNHVWAHCTKIKVKSLVPWAKHQYSCHTQVCIAPACTTFLLIVWCTQHSDLSRPFSAAVLWLCVDRWPPKGFSLRNKLHCLWTMLPLILHLFIWIVSASLFVSQHYLTKLSAQQMPEYARYRSKTAVHL